MAQASRKIAVWGVGETGISCRLNPPLSGPRVLLTGRITPVAAALLPVLRRNSHHPCQP
jgi:hypothetical protein